MQDTTIRTPGETHCPHCDHGFPAGAGPMFPGGWSAHHYQCCHCGAEWSEIRDRITTTRYWDPVPEGARPAARAGG